jgi:Rab GDP dissociation inhibitor
MLDKKFDGLVFDEAGKVTGVKSGEDVAKCSAVVGDPSYFPSDVKTVGKVIRVICLLKHPIPNTNDSNSVQLIIPQRQLNRKYGVYLIITRLCYTC